MNLAWLLDHARLESPEHPALVVSDTGSVLTYRALAERTDQIAGVLEDFGVGNDDVVVTLMPDDAWHYALFYSVIKVGGVFSGFNRILGRQKFAADVERMQARTIVVSREFLETAEHLRATTCLEQIVICDEAVVEGYPNLRPLADAHAGRTRIAPRREDQLVAINYTGGTAGVSKGVMFTHGTLGLSARMTVAGNGITSRDRNVSFISLYHSGGIHDAVVWPMVGGTNILTGGWNVNLFVDILTEHRPTWIKAWVPTMVRDTMKHPAWAELNLTGVHCSLGGEKVPIGMRETLRARGMRVTDTYGLTESMPWAVYSSPFRYGEEELIPTGSCGKPVPEFCESVLKDPASGAIVTTPNTPGEVCIRGGVVSPGYFNDPDRTAAAHDEDGWFHTHDVAWFDADGWYYMQGRVDDIINSGGEKISLNEIEDVLRVHPLVLDVACVSVPHERFGEIPAACIVTAGDTDEDELARALDEHCIANVERWKRPRLYVKLEAIPRTLPKRTKDIGALRSVVAGVRLTDAEGVTSLSLHLTSAAAAGVSSA